MLQKGRVRRARLNYLRQLQGRAARIKGERQNIEEVETVAAPAAAPKAEAPAAKPETV